MEKVKKYQIKDTNRVASRTHNIQKILILLIAIFLGLVAFGSKESFAGTVTTTSSNDEYEFKWEYDLVGDYAENVRIIQVKRLSDSAIVTQDDIAGGWALGDIIIPSTMDTHSVVSIGNGQNRFIFPDETHKTVIESVRSVIIPSTVASINDYAFEGVAMDLIHFGGSERKIGDYAFRNAVKRLHTSGDHILVLPDSLQEIGTGAFEVTLNNHTQLHNEIINRGVSDYEMTVSWNVMGNWGYLYGVDFGPNLQKIGDFAFANTNLLTIDIPDNVTSIGNGAFGNCKYLRKINISERTQELDIGDSAFALSYFYSGGLSNGIQAEITIPSNVKLGKDAFAYKGALKKVTLANDITEIPEGTFYKCNNLEEVVAPGATKIGDYAFFGCENFTNVTANAVNEIGNYSFANTKSLTAEEYTDIVKNATKIGNYAFEKSGITGAIEVKSIVTQLGEGAFQECEGITSATINAQLDKLPNNLFNSCTNLADITKPNTVTEIGDACFKNCVSLDLNTLHNNILPNITTIGKSAFETCTGLNGKLIVPSNVQTIGENAFQSCVNINDIEFKEGIKTIKRQAFWEVGKIPEIIHLPASIEKIEERAFYQVREVFFEGESLPELQNRWYGRKDVITHYKGHKHKVNITCALPGVTIMNNGEAITSGEYEYECGSELNLKLVGAEGYSYPELALKIISEGKYASSQTIEGFAEFDSNNACTIGNILENRESEGIIRDLNIKVQKSKNDTDLVLRQFISEVNGEAISESREVTVVTSKVVSNLEPIQYQHTKYPVMIEKGNTVTYKIRVYNEENKAGKVDEVRVYLQSGLELDTTSTKNTNWRVVETTSEGTIIASDELKNTSIQPYSGEGRPPYEEIELVCKVTNDNSKRLVSIAELSESNDSDSAGKSISLSNVAGYKEEESYLSTYTSFVESAEDDTDYENVEFKDFVKVGYTIAIEKIDSTDLELLNGAKFTLYDEEHNVIETNVTANGGKLEFGEQISYGEGVDTYYIEEVETPAGYLKTIDGELTLTVYKTINQDGTTSVKMECEAVENFDIGEYATYIPISTAEQLAKIGSNEEIAINETTYIFAENENYELLNDIDLSGINWEPIANFEGTLNGNNHKIKNLKINKQIVASRTEDLEKTYCYGLFAEMRGVVKDLALENVDIAVSTDITNEYSSEVESLIDYQINELVNKYRNGELTTNEYIEQHSLLQERKNDLLSIYTHVRVGAFAGLAGSSVFENCSVSGTINTQVCNVGGFIGHTKEGSSVKIKGSANNANITGKNNVAGMVGYSKGNVELVECVNKGTITSTMFNAGGLVGAAESEGTTPENIIVGYDEANKRITIAVKNKRISGKYNLILEKVELDDSLKGVLLDGALFNVYDEDMNILKEYDRNGQVTKTYENVKAENGRLQIAELPLNSLKADVYYIKEVQAPDGYDIKIHDYIKVVVTKTWNSESGKYEININPTVVAGKTETQNTEDSTKTKVVSDIQNSEYVIWKTSRIRASNCTNEGDITANTTSGGVAGGIVGSAVANVDIYDSKNTGTINSLSHTGGIVGAINGIGKYKANIIRCVNGIEGNTKKVIAGQGRENTGLGGMIGTDMADTVISDCINYSSVVSTNPNSSTGGMVGVSLNNDLNVYNCTNNGVVAAGRSAGGILGSYMVINRDYVKIQNINSVIKSGNCRIVNSTNNAGVYSSAGSDSVGATAGILGYAGIERDRDAEDYSVIKNIYIDNCIFASGDVNNKLVINAQGGGDSAAGIAGKITAENIVIKNNAVENVIIQQRAGSNGEIGGLAGKIHGNNQDIYNVEIANNEVKNAEIKIQGGSQNNIGGLAGWISQTEAYKIKDETNEQYATYEPGMEVIIKANNITNCSITNIGAGMSSASAGAIGTIFGGISLELKDCNIVDTYIETTGGNNNLNNGGLIGIARVLSMNIDNCEVKSTTNDKSLIKLTSNGDTSNNGGFIGAIQLTNNEEIRITNSKINNIKVNSVVSASIGGIIGDVDGNTGAKIIIDNVDANNVEIIRENASLYNETQGGYIGHVDHCDSITITNSNAKDVKIGGKLDTSSGGLIGVMYSNGDVNIDGIDMDSITIETDLYRGPQQIDHNKSFGGIVGTLQGQITVNNAKINNVNMNLKNTTVTQAAGLIGWTSGEICDISNVEVSNININQTNEYYYSGKSYSALGGIIGSCQNTLNMQNVTIDNMSIAGDTNARIGGFAGYISKDYRIENCKIEDSKVKSYVETNIDPDVSYRASDAAIGGFVGIAVNSLETDGTIENSSIDNVEITSLGLNENRKTHIGGLIAIAGNTTIVNTEDTVTVNNLTINNKSRNGVVGGIIGVIYGEETVYNSPANTADISNIKVQNLKANGSYAIGGIIGTGIANIRDSVVTNMNTLVPMETSEGNPDWLQVTDSTTVVGGVAGVAVEGSELKNVTVNTEAISNSETTEGNEQETEGTTWLKSNGLAGGIAGVNSGALENGVVENITVESTREYTEYEDSGEMPDSSSEPDEEPTNSVVGTSIKSASELMAQYLEAFKECVVKNVTVINGSTSEVVNPEQP